MEQGGLVQRQESLSNQEWDDLTLDALLGAADDLVEEFGDVTNDALAEEQFVNRAKGLFDAASGLFNKEDSRYLDLVNQLAMRLGEVACNHNHIEEMLGADKVPSNDRHLHDHHDHSSQGRHEDNLRKKGKDNKKSGQYTTLFELISKYFSIQNKN